ncbi:hypothetical protein [Stigmatella aurantiaca]|nr:hypothetical protein [Stigmatella aurantiaca]ADO75088.1 uncharacterized protein STAUR_7332 [Stigmatella aurantiaca DW4/3-1]
MQPVTRASPGSLRAAPRPAASLPTRDAFEVTAQRPQTSQDRDRYFSGFKQGGTGNCVSVAAIKAAMAKFGPDQVFKSVKRSGQGYDVTMRDGVKVRVSDAELATAGRLSRISGRDPKLVRDAVLMYAAMANRAQLEGNDGRKNMSFERACQSLNDGESYREGPRWLGLQKHVRKIDPNDIHRYTAVVGASSRHAVFASDGFVDHYGKKRPSTTRGGLEIEGYGRPLRGAYALV